MSPVTVVAVGDTADNAIAALESSRGPVAVVRRCPELPGLLAACQSGLAQVAVVAAGTDGLTATLVDRLTAVGVSVVAVAATPADAARLRSIGAWPLSGSATAEQLTESVLAAVRARRHHQSASFGFPMAASPSPGSLPPDDAGREASAVPQPGGQAARNPGFAARNPGSAYGRTADWAAGDGGARNDLAGRKGSGSSSPGRAPGGRAPAADGQEGWAGVDPVPVQGAAMAGSSPDTVGTPGADETADAGGAPSGQLRDGPRAVHRTERAGPAGAPSGNGKSGGAPAAGRSGLSGLAALVAAAVPGPSLLRRRGTQPGGGRARTKAAGAGAPTPDRRRGSAQAAAAGSAAAASGPAAPRMFAVWGPIGSPGRTLVAVNMAGELAAEGRRVMLVDADSYGASVAASLGLLDESASFAQACRVADQGLLTVDELARISSEVVCAGGTFSLLTGLTRSDRWPELRAAAVERVLEAALSLVDTVVVDCGFCLETDEELSYDTVAPRRNAATLAALAQADTVFAVGSADAVGIPRLIRALADLPEACAGADIKVVLNKVRKRAAGGSPVKAVEDAWRRFGPVLPISHVLPWEPHVPARALLEGRLLQELAPDSPLRLAIRDMCCALVQGNARTAVSSATARPWNPG
ncbi:hypothetical protein [Arthrobacter sp.]|uniref:nucleotide-binding protein n=1 Tax=Arthrobacter sp. TaxID=1667 RepID=UPI00258B44B9|nr:hypothetical protein [Arthrobacter sp.]